ncbi:MAG: restriction endonuclease [Fluviicola sp.]|nr:restriction endonuclease [Fluviicola sp.]
MPIPKHDEIRIPALEYLRDSKIVQAKEFREPLAQHFNLSEEELNTMYDSGNGQVFYDRISWCLSHLNLAGLVTKPNRGYYKISEKGLEYLSKPEKINELITSVIQARSSAKAETLVNVIPQQIIASKLTPPEELFYSFQAIRNNIYDEILERILSKTPREFEKMVVKLLQKMGYGGEIQNSGTVTSASRDGGIDGTIKEDVLGLGLIHIQAKRYAINASIGRPEIQKFVGALAGQQSKKGVFITTCSYSRDAIEFANSLTGTTLILIDGQKLAEFIYDFGLGMQTEQIIEIKRLDSEFWDGMQDDVITD